MKIKLLLGVVSLLALCSCQKIVTEQECAATRLSTSYAKELEKKDLYLLQGGGSITDKINNLRSFYGKVGYFNVEEARKLYMETLEGYIAKANSCDEIQPFLRDHPFTHDNIELALTFFDGDKSLAPPPYIASVLMIKNNIYYSIFKLRTRTLEIIYREPYEEAFRIVYGGK